MSNTFPDLFAFFWLLSVCYDGPSWNNARLYHGDITEFLELEYRRSTVGGSRGRVRDLDLEVRSESLGLAALIFDSVPVKCENLSQSDNHKSPATSAYQS
ncbi:hypothetical protein T03_2286 [Trichinella britovi]|uniref:Uncharacterized protein n=1 Tax=Trichinella britovi TaxID=45882 RepID=A0A0V1CEG3_TRIBR|nr:hypothetical protein T03_2286 [Trichinella britovi]